MPSPDVLAPFLLAATLLSLAPGPDNLFVLSQSALYGSRSGVLVTLGLCTGLLVHTTAVALGVAALLQTSPVAFDLLRFAGALYLLYLAWLAFTADAARSTGQGSTLRTAGALYRRGIIMNVTNPKVTIFFLAFLPQFVSPLNGSPGPQIIVLGLIFIVVALGVFSGVAVLAGRLSPWLTGSPSTQRLLNRASGILFILLALRLALPLD